VGRGARPGLAEGRVPGTMGPVRPSPASLSCILLALAGCERPARVDLEPGTLRLHARGQSAPLKATVSSSRGRQLPAAACEWSSADGRVATVAGRGREATVTASGPGGTSIRCAAGPASASAAVTVRIASRLEVSPPRLEIRLGDEPAPAALELSVLDTEGRPYLDRPASTRCEDESVCRGDDRGQVWPVGPGETRAMVEVDGARATVPVRVVDARSASGRPRRVEGNPMMEVERAFRAPAR